MERRELFKTALAMSAALACTSSEVFAASGLKLPGIIYTADDPGQWAKKVGSHAPKVSVSGNKVTIVTKHPMTANHYIVRHTLVARDGKVIGSKTFYPSDARAVSTYELPPGHGTQFYATSFCNKHDFWVTEFSM